MNANTTRFCFCSSNLQSATILAVIFASLRALAIFLVWFQVRPDINKTEGKKAAAFYAIRFEKVIFKEQL